MNSTENELIRIIRNIVSPFAFTSDLSMDDQEALFQLAKKHDMAHFIGYALDKHQLSFLNQEVKQACLQQYYQAIFRIEILEAELSNIRTVFEDSGVDFLPLKGAVIRKLYPSKWMRVSADIDILVHPKDLKRAEQVLSDELNYTIADRGPYDVHVMTPNGFVVELHFRLSNHIDKAKELLDNVWSYCSLVPETFHEYQMNDEFFYFYHIFHTARHFRYGGCGVKPVLDTWILNHRLTYNRESRKQLLQQASLLPFSETLEALAEEWFSGIVTANLEDIETYIFEGGVYGGPQKVAAAQAQSHSHFRYIMQRAFPPINSMSYPILDKWKILLPFCWIHRLVKGLFQGKGKKAKYELQKSKAEADRSEEFAALFKRLGM